MGEFQIITKRTVRNKNPGFLEIFRNAKISPHSTGNRMSSAEKSLGTKWWGERSEVSRM